MEQHNRPNPTKQLADLLNQATRQEESFYKHILLVSSSIFGILISLHTNSSPHLYIRVVFLCSVFSLALGILTSAIVLHSYVRLLKKTHQAYRNEFLKSHKEKRMMSPVFAKQSPIATICKKISLTSLSLSILFLVSYSYLFSICSSS